MTEPPKRTQPPDRDEHGRPAATVMSDQERAAIRQVGADDARRTRTRTRQGLPERIEDRQQSQSSPRSCATRARRRQAKTVKGNQRQAASGGDNHCDSSPPLPCGAASKRR
jgi:hypothetical protein